MARHDIGTPSQERAKFLEIARRLANEFAARRGDGDANNQFLLAFADGFSHLYERAVLLEQIRTQHGNARELLLTAIDRIDELCESGLESSRFNDRSSAAPGDQPSTLEPIDSEADVFDLMVRGASNQEIAEELAIALGTRQDPHQTHPPQVRSGQPCPSDRVIPTGTVVGTSTA